jgi:hypothetical protein
MKKKSKSPHAAATFTLADAASLLTRHGQNLINHNLGASPNLRIATTQHLLIYPEFYGVQQNFSACRKLALDNSRSREDVIRWISMSCGLIDNDYRPNQIFKINSSKTGSPDELKIMQDLEGMAKKIVDVYFYVKRQDFRFALSPEHLWYEDLLCKDDQERPAINLTVADEIAKLTIAEIISDLNIQIAEQLMFSSTLFGANVFSEANVIRSQMKSNHNSITTWVRSSGRNRRGTTSNTIDKLTDACHALMCSSGGCTKAAELLTVLYSGEVDRTMLANEKRRLEKIFNLDKSNRDQFWSYKTIRGVK